MEPTPLFLAPKNTESEAADAQATTATENKDRVAPSYTGLFSEKP